MSTIVYPLRFMLTWGTNDAQNTGQYTHRQDNLLSAFQDFLSLPCSGGGTFPPSVVLNVEQ